MTATRAPDDIRARQHLIAHWDQSALADASLTVAGDGLVARFVTLGAAALGIGTGEGWLTLLARARPPLPNEIFCEPDAEDDEDSAVHGIARAAASRYSDCRVSAVPFAPGSAQAERWAPPSDVVVCCASSPSEIGASWQLAARWRAPLVAGITGGARLSIAAERAALGLGDASSPAEPAAGECGGSTALAMLMAGLLLGEVRRLLMPLPGDVEPWKITIEAEPLRRPRSAHLVMVGAGASASAAAVGLAPLLRAGCTLSIWDFDRVEPTNRSRSWFFDGPEPKASALADGLANIVPGACVEPVFAAAGPDLLEREPEAGAVLLNTDTWTSRAEVDGALAAAGGRVGFNVGTSPRGSTTCAMGGGAACLCCRRPDLDDLVAREREQRGRPNSCANQPEGSHIITNMVGGGLQARLVERWLCGGEIEKAVVTYDPTYPGRLMRRTAQGCDCYRKAEAETACRGGQESPDCG